MHQTEKQYNESFGLMDKAHEEVCNPKIDKAKSDRWICGNFCDDCKKNFYCAYNRDLLPGVTKSEQKSCT